MKVFLPSLVILAGALAVSALMLPVAEAAVNKCTRILPTGGREVIINMCNKCRIVSIIRKRPGNAVPVTRKYNVQPNSRITVPFRGPGRSRITSELPCKGDPGAAINLMDPPKPKNKKSDACVKLEKTKDGVVILVNTCKACKVALIERQDRFGGNPKRQAYKVEKKSALTVPQNGGAKIGLLTEIACP